MTQQAFKVAAVQAAPAFLDLAGSVEKAISLIDDAGAQGVKLIAFPETWIPGYPWWIWLGAPAWGMQFVGRYTQNSIVADSPEDQALREACKRNELDRRDRCFGALWRLALYGAMDLWPRRGADSAPP